MGGIGIIHVDLSPGFEKVGIVVDHAAVAVKQCLALAQLYVAGNDGQFGGVVDGLEGQLPGIVQDFDRLCAVAGGGWRRLLSPGAHRLQQAIQQQRIRRGRSAVMCFAMESNLFRGRS